MEWNSLAMEIEGFMPLSPCPDAGSGFRHAGVDGPLAGPCHEFSPAEEQGAVQPERDGN